MYLDVATLERRDGGLARHRDAYQARYDTRTETIGESTMGAGFDESIGARIATVLVERDHREWLAHRWERSHGRDEAGHVPSDWRSGELARFSEIFPHAWDLVIRLRGAHYLVEDMYCLTPDCRCASIAAQFVELVGSKDYGVARAALPALIVEKGPDRARLQELLDAVPRAKIRERYRRVRGFAEDREHRAPPPKVRPRCPAWSCSLRSMGSIRRSGGASRCEANLRSPRWRTRSRMRWVGLSRPRSRSERRPIWRRFVAR